MGLGVLSESNPTGNVTEDLPAQLCLHPMGWAQRAPQLLRGHLLLTRGF